MANRFRGDLGCHSSTANPLFSRREKEAGMSGPRDENELSLSVTTEDGRTFMAVSADGWDWSVLTGDGAAIGSFRSVGLTSVKRILAQTLAVAELYEPGG